MIDIEHIQEIQDYLETPVHIKPPDYYEVVDPLTDELLGTVERVGRNRYQLRVDGEYKITLGDKYGGEGIE